MGLRLAARRAAAHVTHTRLASGQGTPSAPRVNTARAAKPRPGLRARAGSAAAVCLMLGRAGARGSGCKPRASRLGYCPSKAASSGPPQPTSAPYPGTPPQSARAAAGRRPTCPPARGRCALQRGAAGPIEPINQSRRRHLGSRHLPLIPVGPHPWISDIFFKVTNLY